MDKAAIADSLKRFAAEEIKRVLPIEAQIKAHRLPAITIVEEYKDSITSIETGTADDCVNILAGGGAFLQREIGVQRLLFGACAVFAGDPQALVVLLTRSGCWTWRATCRPSRGDSTRSRLTPPAIGSGCGSCTSLRLRSINCSTRLHRALVAR